MNREGFLKRLSVMAGAIVTGVHPILDLELLHHSLDDSWWIQNMIDEARGKVILPPGSYVIARPIRLHGSFEFNGSFYKVKNEAFVKIDVDHTEKCSSFSYNSLLREGDYPQKSLLVSGSLI